MTDKVKALLEDARVRMARIEQLVLKARQEAVDREEEIRNLRKDRKTLVIACNEVLAIDDDHSLKDGEALALARQVLTAALFTVKDVT